MGPTRSFEYGRGFTLIELLIVVAIIGILAAIAVPNFLEAQVRAKVAKVHGEFRTIGTMLEAYHVDWNWYPADYMPYDYCGWPGDPWDFDVILKCLTTPVAYLSNLPAFDPFNVPGGGQMGKYLYENVGDHWYWWDGCGGGGTASHIPTCGHSVSPERCFLWWLRSYGPDRSFEWEWVYRYDASNGTISRGEVVRFGP